MKKFITISLPLIALFFVGCSTQPKVNVGYYHAGASANLKLIQTAACSDGPDPIPSMTMSFKVVPTYYAHEKASTNIPLKKLSSQFSDSELAFEFYDDGRLKSINATQAGQGGALVTSATGLLATLLTTPDARNKGDVKAACQALKKISDKPVTITRVGRSTFNAIEGDIDVSLPDIPSTEFEKIRPIFGTATFSYEGLPESTTRILTEETADSTGHLLELKQPLKMRVTAKVNSVLLGDNKDEKIILTPQHGRTFYIPIAETSLFGGSGFQLVLSESGTIQKLGYTSTSGAARLSGAINETYGAFTTSDTDRLNALKLEADLIAAQQRLIVCQVDPESCQ